ncbi:MAG TPA: nitrite reductase [Syntrophomonas sp.]|jgi:NAD(P)H-nitrite reductase large subunit|nr:nitrite reductase [Syntrophomonas sp.]HCF71015.1 nitrite reductase [Syntrophomonas sp.]
MGTAIFKQINGLNAIVAASECGILTPEQMQGLSHLVQKYDVQALKMSTRQTMVLLVSEASTADIVKELENYDFHIAPFNNTVRNVKACCGSTDFCPRALGNALGLGIEIQNKYMGKEVPHDFKIATAGCTRGCTDPLCADFGVICHDNSTFDIYIGGKGAGKKPVHGRLLISRASHDDVFTTLDFVLENYRTLAQGKERLHKTIARTGLEPFLPSAIKPNEAAAAVDTAFLDMLNS